MKAYKFIQSDMKSKNGNHTWELGKWYKEEELKICEKGFHACEEPIDSLSYVYGNKFFIVEAKGKIIKENDKFVASEMRLVKEIDINIFKRFAIFCAKQCLSNFEKEYPNDKRPFEAIKAAEYYLDSKISLDDLNKKISAAESAAESAWSAAESAAESAWSAARSAWSAAESAWSAARSAAESAAESARSAAESAAESAWSAARSARSAAKKAQNKELLRLIKLSLKQK